MKVSEIFKAALNGDYYLNKSYWFCSAVDQIGIENELPNNIKNECSDIIYESISNLTFLHQYLKIKFIIKDRDQYSSEDEYYEAYGVAARAHWNALIAKLEAEGK